MKLYYSPTSPFARKTAIVAMERQLDTHMDFIKVNPLESKPGSAYRNPSGKIPTLERDQEPSLFDSRVICRFLNSLGDGPDFYGTEAANKLQILGLEALADGVMTAALKLIYESKRSEAQQSRYWKDRWWLAIRRGLSVLSAECAASTSLDAGRLGAFCALEYLEFRLPELAWRTTHPGLNNWANGLAERPALLRTRPTHDW